MTIRILASARHALLAHWPSAALIVGLGLTGVAAGSVVEALGSRSAPRAERLALPPIPPSDRGVKWNPDAASATDIRAAATRELLDLLSLTAWAVVAVAACSILVLGATRAAERRVDLRIHRAVGASRSALVKSALVEGAVLAALAAAIGAGLGAAGAHRAASSWPGGGVWHWVALGVIAVIGGTVLIGALFPLASIAPRRITEAAPAPAPLGLAAVQLAVGLTVLVAGAVMRDRAAAVLPPPASAAIDAEGLVYPLDLGSTPLPERGHTLARLLGRLAADSSVALASIGSPGALVGLGTVDDIETECGYCVVGGIVLQWRVLRATHHFASADTFYARGLAVTEGRTFGPADTLGAAPVAVVNRHLAARYFEGGKALGRSLWLGGRMSGNRYRVIGVVDGDRPTGFGAGLLPREAVYLSVLQHPGTGDELLVRPRRAGRAAAAGRGPIEATLGRVGRPRTETAIRTAETAPVEWFADRFRLEGAAALLLATAGLFGLMHLWVDALRPELAIRRALGARRRRVAGSVLLRAVQTAISGLAIALVFFAPFLWGELARLDPMIPALPVRRTAELALALVAAALAGALVPAVRAALRPPAADLGS